MNKSILSAIPLFLFAFCVMSVSAQTVPGKIVVINSYNFGDEKAGITKYVAAVKQINLEFAPLQKEIETMSARLNVLAREIDALRTNPAANPNTAQAKVDEAEKLQLDIKRKTEDGKVRLEKRQPAVLGPVMDQIGKALTDFAKQKGYALIFDLSKDRDGFLVAIGEDKIDVTIEFIAFFNAR